MLNDTLKNRIHCLLDNIKAYKTFIYRLVEDTELRDEYLTIQQQDDLAFILEMDEYRKHYEKPLGDDMRQNMMVGQNMRILGLDGKEYMIYTDPVTLEPLLRLAHPIIDDYKTVVEQKVTPNGLHSP